MYLTSGTLQLLHCPQQQQTQPKESPATSASFPLHARLLGPAHCLSALFLCSTFCTDNILCINKGVKIKQSGIYVISYKCLATTTLVTPTRTRKEEIINTQESSDSSHGAPFNRTAVMLPPFWPDRPALWFAQAEAQFELAVVTSVRTKFNYLISHLDHRHSAEVENVVTSPKAKHPYKMLKTELVSPIARADGTPQTRPVSAAPQEPGTGCAT